MSHIDNDPLRIILHEEDTTEKDEIQSLDQLRDSMQNTGENQTDTTEVVSYGASDELDTEDTAVEVESPAPAEEAQVSSDVDYEQRKRNRATIDALVEKLYNETDSPYMILPTAADPNEIRLFLESMVTFMGIDVFERRVQEDGFIRDLVSAMSIFNQQVYFNRAGFKKFVNRDPETFKRVMRNIGEATARKTNLSENERVLSGDSGRATLMARMQGIRRIPLLNSGFHVNLRTVTMPEIGDFHERIHSEEIEYGKLVGSYFYQYADFFTKRALMDMILKTVVDSNLNNYKRRTELLQSISILDYEVLLWAVAQMMHRDGVDTRIVCTHENCGYVHPIKLDLSKMRLNDFSKMSDDTIEFMCNIDKVRKSKDLEHYHEMLNFTETIQVMGNWEIVLRVPSMATYFQFGDLFMAELLKDLKPSDLDSIENRLIFRSLQQYAPWIAEVREIIPGERPIVTKDPDTIMTFLRICQGENNMNLTEFTTKVEEFMQKSRISHIAFRFDQCPQCNQAPSGAIDGYMTYDVQTSFFTLAVLKTRG